MEWAAKLAEAVAGDLLLVHAVGLLAHVEGTASPVSANDHREDLRRQLEEWSAPARERGVAHRAELIDGEPVTVLLDAVDREHAAGVVVGSRGVGLAQTLLGGTSLHLTMQSSVPVTVVP